jgi:hypothetical protein
VAPVEKGKDFGRIVFSGFDLLEAVARSPNSLIQNGFVRQMRDRYRYTGQGGANYFDEEVAVPDKWFLSRKQAFAMTVIL